MEGGGGGGLNLPFGRPKNAHEKPFTANSQSLLGLTFENYINTMRCSLQGAIWLLTSSRLIVELVERSSSDGVKQDNEGRQHQHTVTNEVVMIFCTWSTSMSNAFDVCQTCSGGQVISHKCFTHFHQQAM